MIIKAEALLTPERYGAYRRYASHTLGADQDSYLKGWEAAVNFVYENVVVKNNDIECIKKIQRLMITGAASKSAKRRRRLHNKAIRRVLKDVYAMHQEN